MAQAVEIVCAKALRQEYAMGYARDKKETREGKGAGSEVRDGDTDFHGHGSIYQCTTGRSLGCFQSSAIVNTLVHKFCPHLQIYLRVNS